MQTKLNFIEFIHDLFFCEGHEDRGIFGAHQNNGSVYEWSKTLAHTRPIALVTIVSSLEFWIRRLWTQKLKQFFFYGGEEYQGLHSTLAQYGI